MSFDDDTGLRRSAFEAGGLLTTMMWDGTDYLVEKADNEGRAVRCLRER